MAYIEEIGPKQRARELELAYKIKEAGLVGYKVENDHGNYRWEFTLPGGQTMYATNLHNEAIDIIDQAPRVKG